MISYGNSKNNNTSYDLVFNVKFVHNDIYNIRLSLTAWSRILLEESINRVASRDVIRP
jgi:hypothetical protein